MRYFVKLIMIVLFSGLIIGCKTYRGIEKVTVKNDANLSTSENLNRQLKQVQSEEKIQVFLQNGKFYNLEYLSHTSDTLQSRLRVVNKEDKKAESYSPMALPLSEIKQLNVWRTNYLISIGLPAGVLIGTIIIISSLDYSADYSWD